MGIEHRVSPRAACRFPAAAEGPRGPVRGTCTNISLGGLFLEGVQLPMGTTCTVTVSHPALGDFSATAQVRHHASAPRGMGVQFMRLEPTSVALLERILRGLPPPL